jgi:isopentenyldiphosphate isomerase
MHFSHVVTNKDKKIFFAFTNFLLNNKQESTLLVKRNERKQIQHDLSGSKRTF